jgi:hypothetical protein
MQPGRSSRKSFFITIGFTRRSLPRIAPNQAVTTITQIAGWSSQCGDSNMQKNATLARFSTSHFSATLSDVKRHRFKTSTCWQSEHFRERFPKPDATRFLEVCELRCLRGYLGDSGGER